MSGVFEKQQQGTRRDVTTLVRARGLKVAAFSIIFQGVSFLLQRRLHAGDKAVVSFLRIVPLGRKTKSYIEYLILSLHAQSPVRVSHICFSSYSTSTDLRLVWKINVPKIKLKEGPGPLMVNTQER